jgi:hypothetical protein
MYRVGFKKFTPGKIPFVFYAKYTKVRCMEGRMGGLVDSGIAGSFAGMSGFNPFSSCMYLVVSRL